MFSKWLPDRKVWASGLAGLLAFFVTTLLSTYTSVVVPYEVALEITIAVVGLVAYVVPPSVADVAKRVNDKVLEIVNSGSPPNPNPNSGGV